MSNRFIVIIILANWFLSGTSQGVPNPEKTFYDAEFLVMYDNYQDALPLYLSLLNSGQSNANVNYKIGQSYLHIPGKKSDAVPYLENAVKNISWKSKSGSFKEVKAPFDAQFLLAKAYHANNELDKATAKYKVFINEANQALEKYKSNLPLAERIKTNLALANSGLESCQVAIELQETPVDHDMRENQTLNPGNVNFRPAISGDGKTMAFMSNRKYYDAIYTSRKENMEWTEPENITMEIESDGTFQLSSISYDGNNMLLIHSESNDLDLYQSSFSGGRWSRMSSLNKNINSNKDEIHGCLSPDGKTLYFVSNRKGGIGGLDIYQSRLGQDGDWEEASNLGEPVNTAFDEHSPFLSPDGEILYFSSTGHRNMGGYDIFYSRKEPGGNWAEPINIGYPINTTNDDLFFSPARKGELGYMARYTPENRNEQKIFEVEFYSETNPRRTVVTGIVEFEGTRRPSDKMVKVSLINAVTFDTLKTFITDLNKGEYTFHPGPGKYEVYFQKEGYYPKTESLIVSSVKMDKRLELKTTMVPEKAKEEKIYLIGFILFGFDDYSLSKSATSELDNISLILDKYPELKLVITGHTDSKGSVPYNLSLSEKRARSVYNYLVKNGADGSRLGLNWKGESEPAAIERNIDGTDNPEGRTFNRRVNFNYNGPAPDNVKMGDMNVPVRLQIR